MAKHNAIIYTVSNTFFIINVFVVIIGTLTYPVLFRKVDVYLDEIVTHINFTDKLYLRTYFLFYSVL